MTFIFCTKRQQKQSFLKQSKKEKPPPLLEDPKPQTLNPNFPHPPSLQPVANGFVSSATTVLYGESVTLACNDGFFVVPGSGSEQPSCGVRPGCVFTYENRADQYGG
jgi:hypothetical protein